MRDFSNIENLIFSGGGVRIVGEIGGIAGLEKKGVLKQIKRVGGTSAGSICASLMSMGYTVSEMTNMVNSLDFKSFEDGNVFDDLNLISKYGIHPATTFLTWIQSVIKKKTCNPLSTFADFNKLGYLELAIFATNLKTQNVERFDFKNTPNVPVCFAVRCSMSIPLFFYAFKIPSHTDAIYVDGGCDLNYPISAFDESCECANEKTLGFAFKNTVPTTQTNLEYFQFPKYVKIVAEMLLNAQDISLTNNPANAKRTIFIPSNISTTNFGITSQEKQQLYASGLNSVLNS